MNYETIEEIIAEDDQDTVEELLVSDVIGPVLSECEIDWKVDDVLEPRQEFIKNNLLNIFNFLVLRSDGDEKKVVVTAHYVDTLPTMDSGTFAKTRVIVSISGNVRPGSHEYNGFVRTKPFEVV